MAELSINFVLLSLKWVVSYTPGSIIIATPSYPVDLEGAGGVPKSREKKKREKKSFGACRS